MFKCKKRSMIFPLNTRICKLLGKKTKQQRKQENINSSKNFFIAMKVPLLLLLMFLTSCLGDKQTKQKQRVILISIDGFRWDYKNCTEYKMENLNKLIENGVTVDYVKNVFPTNTYPNHQSIITGLYPEHHGLIDNRMFDPNNGTIFEPGVTEERWWNQAEPLWITNQKQGFESGIGYWPGSDVKLNGSGPTYTFPGTAPYIKKKGKAIGFDERVNKAVDWLQRCKQVNLVAIYFEEPDKTTHDHGADSNETKVKNLFKTALSKVDMAIGKLVGKLNETGLLNETNIIIIGDHGSLNTTHEKVIDIDQYVDTMKTVRYFIGFTYASVWPNTGQLEHIYNKLKDKNPHLKVYLKKDIPESFHIKHHNRTAPLLLFPDPGWIIRAKKERVPYLNEDFCRGEHGYSNLCRKMNPGFAAYGPAFKKGYQKESIESVDIYPLICKILGLKPLKNDGKLERTIDFLEERFVND